MKYRKEGKEEESIWFDVDEKELSNEVAKPFSKGDPFLFALNKIDPQTVEKFDVFFSEQKHFSDIDLPDGRSVIYHNAPYTAKCFYEGKVEAFILYQ